MSDRPWQWGGDRGAIRDALRQIDEGIEQAHAVKALLLTLSALLRELGRPGMVWVPEEPTEAMLIAGNKMISSEFVNKRTVAGIYKAMLTAREGK